MKKDNNKIKKIGAWIAIIILLLACCMPMIFAFGNGEDSQVYFKASLAGDHGSHHGLCNMDGL